MTQTLLRTAVRQTLFCAAIILQVLATSTSLKAQTPANGTIHGRVSNAATGDYLRNATIAIPGTDISTTAGPGGNYVLNNVPVGEVKLEVTYVGLDSAVETVKVDAGQTVERDFNLTSKDYNEVITLGAFKVQTGREGNAKAIMEQRTAVNFKKVIAADAIGNVSEGNVGEFLKLMPGVKMDYVEADTRTMRIRGYDPKYAGVLLDGLQVANAGSANISTGRAFEFEQLSISSVETVELSKAISAELPSSVAGTANLRTGSAFDHKGRRIKYKFGLSENSYDLKSPVSKTQGWDDEHHYKMLPNLDLSFSDVYLDGKLGVSAGLSMNSTLAYQKHIWFFYANNTDPRTVPGYDNSSEFPNVTRIWYQDGPKPTERSNYYVRLDYKFTDYLTAHAYASYNNYDARFYNRSISFYPLAYDPASTRTNAIITNGNVAVQSNQYMQKAGTTNLFNGGLTYDRDDFKIDLGVQYSYAKSHYENLNLGHFSDFSASLRNISWTMTRAGADSQDVNFTQLTGVDWRNLANYRFDGTPGAGSLNATNSLIWYDRRSSDEVTAGRLDFSKKLQLADVANTLRWGVRSTFDKREVHRYTLNTNYVGADGISGTADDNPALFQETNYTTDWGVGGNANGWVQISPWKLAQSYSTRPAYFVDNVLGNLTGRLRDNWLFDEKVHGAYVDNQIVVGKLTVVPGIRYEYTDTKGTGANVLSDARTTAMGFTPGTEAFVRAKFGGKLTAGRKFGSTMKYLTANYKVSKRLMVRSSFHDAITRADMANLIPGVSGVDETNQIVSASNPDLKAERSQNFNLGAEYYFEPVGVISASVFQSTLKNRQASNLTFLDSTGYLGDTYYANWRLNSTFNVGNKLTIRGFEVDYAQELSFLPSPFNGFGVFANYTQLQYSDYAFFAGSALWSGNGGISYKQKRWSARLNGNMVGKVLRSPGRTYSVVTGQWTAAAPFAPEYQAARLQFDLSIEFNLNSAVTLFVDGRNILNEPSVYEYRGIEDNFTRVLRTGGIWQAGVKGRF